MRNLLPRNYETCMRTIRHNLWGVLLLVMLSSVQVEALAQALASNNSEQAEDTMIRHQNSQHEDHDTRSLEEVLKELESTYLVHFGYEGKIVEGIKIKDIPDEEKNLESILSYLLSPYHLRFEKLSSDSYVIYSEKQKKKNPKLENIKPQTTGESSLDWLPKVNSLKNFVFQRDNVFEKEVTGKVTDLSDDAALPGVNIIVKGTTIGTVTDIDGNYRITVPGNESVLVFSSVGYTTEEVTVGTQSRIDVAMAPDVQALSEVVVVGYGTQERAKVTGAISSVSAEEITALPVPSLDAALQGRAAGVTITNSGAPGVNPQVRIRGIGTVGNTEPLYVIDGVPTRGGLNSINPNDIESIEVLKDAATAAIYGSRGANGVVMVTTKKGKAGEVRVNLDSYYGIQNAWKQLDLLNVDQYLAYGRELQENASQPVPQRFDDLGEFANVETDWQDAMFRTAPIQDHNLSITGGTEKATFNVGGGYFEQEGIMLGTGFKRVSFRANTEFDLGRVTIGNTLTLAHTNRQVEPFIGGRSQIEHIIKGVPYIPIRDASRIGGFRTPDRIDGSDPENPVLNATLVDNRNRDFRILGSAYADVDIVDGLRYRFMLGFNGNYGHNRNFVPIYDAGDFAKNPTADLTENRTTLMSPLISNQLNYSKTFGDHSIDAIAVLERQTAINTNSSAAGENTISSDIPVLGSVSNPVVGGERREYALISYIGRLNYDYAGKYLLSASIRRDGGSRFSPDQKWGTFPSVSAGWRISEEAFLQNVALISDLKLRASWGKTGNDEISDYGYRPTLTGNFYYNFNDNLVPAYTIRALANPNIKWETTVMTNIGLDLGLLEDRVMLSVEYFNNETQDMLLGVPIPPSLGYDVFPTANVGTVSNKGFEITAGYNKGSGDFQWSLNGNISFVKNELVSLGIGNTIFGPAFEGDPTTYTEEGEPIAYFYGWEVEGIFQSEQEIEQANALDGDANTPYQNSSTSPGDIRFRDLDGNGTVDADDRTNIGHYLPDFFYGLNASANWRNFDFTMFIQGVSGNEILNTNTYDLEGMTRLFNAGTAVLDRWTEQNRDTDVPRAVTGDPNRNARLSTRYIEDGSYLRIKNLSIGYSLPSQALNVLGSNFISSVRIYVSSQNLLTLTDYSGYDPEIGVRSDLTGQNASLSNGVDYGQFPQARTFLAGIQIGF